MEGFLEFLSQYLGNLKWVPMVTEGLQITLFVFVVVLVSSIPLGFLLSLILRSRFKPIKWIADFYVLIMRGTPLMLQLYFFYFGLAEILPMEREVAAIVSFICNYTAYFAVIFVGGFLAIDKGQYEAAKVLGMTRPQTLRKIIIPQMIKVVLPSLSNETITLVKDTALVSTIAVTEILHLTKNAVNTTVSFTPFIYAAILYLMINFVMTLIFNAIQKKFMFESKV